MQNLKINWMIASITAIVLLFGAFVMVKAMEKEEVVVETKTETTTTTYYYNGPAANLPTNIMAHGNWNPSQNENFICDPEEEDIPCSLEVPDGKTVQQYLSELGNLSAILSATPTRRADAE